MLMRSKKEIMITVSSIRVVLCTLLNHLRVYVILSMHPLEIIYIIIVHSKNRPLSAVQPDIFQGQLLWDGSAVMENGRQVKNFSTNNDDFRKKVKLRDY